MQYLLLVTEHFKLRIKANHILLFINLFTLALILVVVFLPDNFSRIVLGLPFVLFFPGYALLTSLFPRKDSLNDIERLALTFGLSLAIVPLIGLLLNYLPWGININSILYSLSVFVVVMSVIAWLRQRRLSEEERFALHINFGAWSKQKLLEKVLSIILVFVVIGLVGVVAYTIAVPRTSEQYTELHVLNLEGKASDYPSELNLGDTGKVTLGIVNHERQVVSYRVETTIDGVTVGTIGPVVLENEEKYETIADFKPQKIGDHQKVEFLLFRDESSEPYLQVQIWIDVK